MERAMHRGSTMSARHDIQARTFALACRIIDFCRQLARSGYVVRRLASQLLDAGTSIGANLEEADAAQTKRDFLNAEVGKEVMAGAAIKTGEQPLRHERDR